MICVTLTVRRSRAEDVLDRLLPMLPGGVHERERGAFREIEIFGREDELPSEAELRRAAGSLARVTTTTAPDDWRERRRLLQRPVVIGGRIVVRAPWMPRPRRDMIDVVLEDRHAFGTGSHPTTRACLELMLGLERRGSLADVGCGSGVLSIAAARLGFSPVLALDLEPRAVAATEANARANGVAVTARVGDGATAASDRATIVANVPAQALLALGGSLTPATRRVIASGIRCDAADEVIAAFGAQAESGPPLELRTRRDVSDWSALLFERAVDHPER